jgi:hypothetical protein
MEIYQNENAKQSPEPTEGEFTKAIEEYTASIPSSAYLAVAVGAMGLSLLCQVTGQGNGETLSRNGFRLGSSSGSTTKSSSWKGTIKPTEAV